MRYINKHGFIWRVYYDFTVVDLWVRRSSCDTGEAIPLFSIDLLRTDCRKCFSVAITIPWVRVGLGLLFK